MNIENIKISGFFGRDVNINIKNNVLIIVADNGSGKTTLLRLIFFFLTKQWSKIIDYDFDKITAVINGEKFSFVKASYLSSKFSQEEFGLLAKKYSSYSHFILEQFSKLDLNELKSSTYKIDEVEQRFDVPKNLLFSLISEIESKKFDNTIYNWEQSVIYLPTYRRIEKDYFSIYGDIDKRLSNYILTILPELYNKIVVEKKENDNVSETEEDLNLLFSNIINSRNNERWLKNKSNSDYLEMIEFGMTDVHFGIKEFLGNGGIENDSDQSNKSIVVTQFIVLINKYLTNGKKLVFNEKYCELSISSDSGIFYKLDELSSGEKQIISIFSHLFFTDKKIFIIIDEPEISLSIAWQEMILEDIILNSDGVFVATHSPFIVNTNSRENTHGINEFFKNE